MKARAITFLILSLAITANASEILYDTLRFVDEQLYDAGNGNAISGLYLFGQLLDRGITDDFVVPGDLGYELDTVTQDHLTFLGRSPADGILIEVFGQSTMLGHPPEVPLAAYFATGDQISASPFEDTVFGLIGRRFSVNLPDGAIVLPPGSYFISQIPVDTSDRSDWYYTARDNDSFIGTDSFDRDGGFDHERDGWYFGGGSGGLGTTDFVSLGELGFGVGDVSMRITGTEIPEPVSGVLLLASALIVRQR